MTPQTPPGTVPLMDYEFSLMGWHHPHKIDDHPGGVKCLGDGKWSCGHIGFRVVDEAEFNEWKTGLTKPNMAR